MESEHCQLKEHLVHIENELNTIQEASHNNSQDIIITKEGRAYNSTMRKMIYTALDQQVPVDKAVSLAQAVAGEYTGSELALVPCPATVARMGRDWVLGSLSDLQSDLQSGEALVASNSTTIA